MNFLLLDFETFFSKDYTLKKLTTEAYIRSPSFEVHGAAVKWGGGGPAVWLDESQLRSFFQTVDWSTTATICHHQHFDGFILSHHFQIIPRLYVCTLSMARLLIGNHISASLDSIREQFGLPPKITPYNAFINWHWRDMSPYLRHQVAAGACDEVESIWTIFQGLAKVFPTQEYEVIDATVRMFTQPMVRGNIQKLADVWTGEENAKKARREALGLPDDTALLSAEKFAQLLRDVGMDPETKEGKKGPIYAFAKTDQFMQDLLEDENEYVRQLAAARLGAKSTLLQTRAETFGWMATRGPLPIYLGYAAAHTTRWGGGDRANFQNLPARKKEGLALRQAIEAPEGYEIVKPDLSQIECRLLHCFAGDEEMTGKFARGEDPYVDLASAIYGEKIYKPKKGDPRELEMETKRGTGKQGRLMCGYGAGWLKYQFTAKAGQYGPPIVLPDEEAKRHVAIYRETNPFIAAKGVGLWAVANRMIARLAGGPPLDWGPLKIADNRIWLPNGCPLIYVLSYNQTQQEWKRKTRQGEQRFYGAKLVENVIQAMARCVISDAMVRLVRIGYRIVNTEHDSLWILVEKGPQLEQHKKIIMEQMKQRPSWMPNLPLDVEIH